MSPISHPHADAFLPWYGLAPSYLHSRITLIFIYETVVLFLEIHHKQLAVIRTLENFQESSQWFSFIGFKCAFYPINVHKAGFNIMAVVFLHTKPEIFHNRSCFFREIIQWDFAFFETFNLAINGRLVLKFPLNTKITWDSFCLSCSYWHSSSIRSFSASSCFSTKALYSWSLMAQMDFMLLLIDSSSFWPSTDNNWVEKSLKWSLMALMLFS